MLYQSSMEAVEAIITMSMKDGQQSVERAARSLLVNLYKANIRSVQNKIVVRNHLSDGLTQQEVLLASQERMDNGYSGKIEAVKKVRERTQCGLVEAKNLVENWMDKHLGFHHWPARAMNTY